MAKVANISGSMARLSAALANTHTAGGTSRRGAVEQPAIAELKALAEIDVAHIDLDPNAFDFGSERHSDDLRLGRPPRRSKSPAAVTRSMARALRQFQPDAPVAASEEALVAEARLMSVVRGIHDLKVEIEAQRRRAQTA